MKVLFWDGQGLVLYAKWLERGRFVGPTSTEGVVSLTPAQLSMLTEGITGGRHCVPDGQNWRADARSFGLERRGRITEFAPVLITSAELPTEVAALQAMVLAQDAELAAARAGIIAQRREIEKLKARIARLLRQSHSSSSERLRGQVEQRELRLAPRRLSATVNYARHVVQRTLTLSE